MGCVHKWPTPVKDLKASQLTWVIPAD
jgi:hypothetical protein